MRWKQNWPTSSGAITRVALDALVALAAVAAGAAGAAPTPTAAAGRLALVGSLAVSPATAAPNHAVQVTYTVANTGDQALTVP